MSAWSHLPSLRALLRMSALRQSLLLALAFVVLTVIAGIVAITLISDALTDTIDEQLQLTAQSLTTLSTPERVTVLARSIDDQALGALADDGRLVGPMTRNAFAELGARTVFGDDIGLDDDDWRLLVVETAQGRLAVATELDSASDTVGIVASALGTVLAITVLACLAIGLAIGVRAQARLGRMTATLDRFAAGDLTARIDAGKPRRGQSDDLGHAARRIDETLGRLQTLVEQMRDLSASLAHELKTPLARLRASVETLAAEAADPQSQAALHDLLTETDQVIRIFDALLRIAQLDAGARRDRFVQVDLAGLAQDLGALYRPLIEGSGRTLDLTFDGATATLGDRDLIGQMIANLLENAIAHTPVGTAIGLAVTGSRLTVQDDGAGIAQADRQRILEPFYRTPSAGAGSGLGLGLAMVRAIADLHGATITVTDARAAASSGGFRIEIGFPASTRD